MSANFSYYPPNEPRYILITGAASGLGRCFLDHYTHKHPHASFWAVDRHMPDHKPVYPGLQGRIEWIQLDLTDEAAVREHLELENSLRGQWDLVIHCAGVRGLRVGDGGLRNQKDVEVADGLWQIDKAVSPPYWVF